MLLRGYRWIETEQGLGVPDWVRLGIRNTAAVLLELLQVWNNDDPFQHAWVSFQVLASGNHGGQSIRVQLRAYNGAAGPTSFFFGSLQLDATIPTGVVEPGVTVTETWAETKSKYR